MVKVLFFHFRFTNWKLKNKRLHFELLTASYCYYHYFIVIIISFVTIINIIIIFTIFSPLLTTTFLLFLLRDHNENKAFCLFCVIPAI